jgi:hypothetical protein
LIAERRITKQRSKPMSKKSITVAYDGEKLSALEQYMAKKNVRLCDELEKQIASLYGKYVPPQVREYIEGKAEPEPMSRARPLRSPPEP